MQQKLNKIFSILLFVAICLGLSSPAYAAPRMLHGGRQKVCDQSQFLSAGCSAQVVTDVSGKPAASATLPSGYGPAQFHTAYQLPSTAAKPATLAVVDAYDDPDITSDLANYDKVFGLPVFPSCSATVTTSCFQKVNQNGSTIYPARDSSWSVETSLDVETAHEICQNCKLILVEANSASYTNLMMAVDRARLMGATVISNSYGSSEFSSEAGYDSHFKYPGIAFVFSAGDGGYGAIYPAASPLVTAVGGTTLTLNSSNVWQSETVWSGTGSGCSNYEAKQSFQTDPKCTHRTVADVAADADPNTGAAVYDSVSYYGMRGWFQVGGTSLAAPIIAGIYGLSNNFASSPNVAATPYTSYNYLTNLHDITAGSNGFCGSYLCQAATGFDGPTGLGTPKGLTAF